MKHQRISGLPLILALFHLHGPSPALLAQGQTEEIALNWAAEGFRQIMIVDAAAASTLRSADGKYSAARAADGNRGTKWVASTAPSETSPQWITLKWAGKKRLHAVALFGEAPDNDGVRDAKIQIAGKEPDTWTTVAAIEDAQTRSWLATFAPMETAAVRFLVTRSGGPTAHTDIYEIELYGPPLTPEELKVEVGRRLKQCRGSVEAAIKAATKIASTAAPLQAESRQAARTLARHHQEAARRFSRWDALDPLEREKLADEAERLGLRALRFAQWLKEQNAVPAGMEEVARLREESRARRPAHKVLEVEKPGHILLQNRHLVVDFDRTNGRWNAAWLGALPAGFCGAQFLVEAGSESLRAQGIRAEVEPFTDQLGGGLKILQRWGGKIEIERSIRVYEDNPAISVSGRLTNKTDQSIRLHSATMLDLSPSNHGWWSLGRLFDVPAAVGYPGTSPPCRPGSRGDLGVVEETYASSGILALAQQEPRGGLAIGFLTAWAGAPQIRACFRAGQGGTALSAVSDYRGRMLAAGETIEMDMVWICVEPDPFAAMERYGDAVAVCSRRPARTGANSLWCSWYPIRMGISEEVVLANAEIAARHFKPLGFDLIQLDHGWQRGDVCGDWIPNQRFPHGLKWLSEQLHARFGMRLGLWIAPTTVAETSQLFQSHPDWLLHDPEGKPAATGRWYWAPNPETYLLDASHPEANQWLQETFARLTAQGVSYYKIDFIAASGGSYRQHDRECPRGWGVLRRGMEAIRVGAGPDAWIRYCQTPPLLSVGLADSSYIGIDTGDAGLAQTPQLLRENARLLAASYWVNDRLYHREVCDMSVGNNASVEEARMRLALMTLSGCSISFSDDLRELEPPRIEMMQQCLPAGNPAARPLDLFERANPSLWHLHCKTAADEWDVVGLFNFGDDPAPRSVSFAALDLPKGAKYTLFEFWQEKFLGIFQDGATITLPAQTSRVLIIRRWTGRPQLVGTDMHMLGGFHEIDRLGWDEDRATLSGAFRRAAGLSGKATIHVPERFHPSFQAGPQSETPSLTKLGNGIWRHTVRFTEPSIPWSLTFDLSTERSGKSH